MSQHDALAPEHNNGKVTKRLADLRSADRLMTQVQPKDAVNGGPPGENLARSARNNVSAEYRLLESAHQRRK